MPVGAFVPSRIHTDYPEWQTPVGGDTGKVWAYTGSGYAPASFLSASAVSAFGLTLIDDADAATARTTLGLGTAATLNVGTSANNVVQLNGSAQLPAVDGSQLTGITVSAAGSTTQVIYNASGVYAGHSGMTYSSANSRLTVTGGLVAPSWRPASDSTTALQLQNAAGTATVTVDTTNSRLIASTVVPGATNSGNLGLSSLTYANVFARNLTSNGNLLLTAGAGGGTVAIDANGVSAIAQFASTGITFSKTLTFSVGAGLVITGNVAFGDPAGASRNHALHGHTTFTPGIDAVSGGAVTIIKGYTGQSQNLTEWQNASGTVLSSVSADGFLDLAASTTSRASLRIRAGTAPTTPNAGDIWYASGGRLSLYRAATEIFATGVQATGGAATAGASYTSTEQSMIQKCYDACRAFGLLS